MTDGAGCSTQDSVHRGLDHLAMECWQAPGMLETDPSDLQLDWKPETKLLPLLTGVHLKRPRRD